MTNIAGLTAHIVVGVDHSPAARYAAEWAAYEAEDQGLTLLLLHALSAPEGGRRESAASEADSERRDAAELVNAVAGQLRRRHPALTVATGVAAGSAAPALVSAATGDTELVVTGCRGYDSAAGLPPGSATRALAACSPKPFVAVRGEPRNPADGEIVLCIGPDEDPMTIRFALRRAERQGSRVLAVRAWQPTGYSDGGSNVSDPDADRAQREQARRLLDLVRDEFPEAQVSLETTCDATVPALLLAAQRAQMLVLGMHRTPDRPEDEPRVGSTLYELLVHCPVPLAIIPPERRR